MINSAAFFNTLLASDDKQKCALELNEICRRFKQNGKKFSDDYDAELFLWRFIHPTDFIKWHDRDVYFNPKFDRLAWLLAAGDSPEVYERKVREYNDAVTCGLVWTQNYLAYRCRTCSSTPSMAICTECFLNGQHEGHDFIMFRSQAGGACDCGDPRVMRESGFCSKHGTNVLKTKRKAPEELFSTADVLLPHLIKCILLVFASSYKPEYVDEIQILTTSSFKPAERLVSVLQKFSDYGAAAKERLSAMLMDSDNYRDFATGVSHFQDESDFMCAARDRYRTAVKSSDSICSKEDAESLDCPLACCDLEHCSFLDEMVFWLIKLKMPQPLVTLLLSLLPCDVFKAQFINLFATHYSRMIMMLVDESRTVSSLGGDPTSEAISNRVVHISVQLLSNDSISMLMCTEHKFVRVLVASLYNTIKRCLVESTLNTVSDNFHLVADCRHRLMENQSYWVTSHDLRNILSHKEVALNFLSRNGLIFSTQHDNFCRDPPLLDVFAALVSTLQGINPNTRELSGHVEYESRSYFAAFSAELELCSLISRTLLEHLKDQDSFDCILSMLQNVTCHIQDWFDAVHFTPPYCWKPPLLECCFHFPLHRLWASFLCQGLKLDMQLNLPSESFLRQLMMHPLSIQVCATKVNPEWLILTFFERFHLVDWLSFSPAKPIKKFLRSEWESPMLESCLKLIASLVTNRINLGLNEKDCLRMEIASLLCQNDKSHSQIVDSLSHTTLSSKAHYAAHIEEILKELADYVAPQFVPGGAMSEGIYTPKSIVWEKYFDPLFLSLRIVQPKDFQTAMNRYKKHLKARNLIGKESTSIIPPYRLPGESFNGSAAPVYDNLRRVLNSRSLHAVLFIILLKALNNENSVSENVLSLALYLLRLILYYTVDERKQCNVINVKPVNTVSQRPNVLDLQFCGWFASNCIFENMTQIIQSILCIDNVPGLSRSCHSHVFRNLRTESDHGDFPDLERLRARTIRTRVYPESPEEATVFSPEGHSYRSKASKALDIPFIDSSMELDTTLVYEDSDPDMLYNSKIL
uniref:E3 ubiquitin-protein ligase n=1 Tax=Romanomermis culicivorax TaxID=13658 RepID=A0A915KPQ5_ROMCU